MSSRKGQREAARAARLEREAREAAQATRRRRLSMLGGVVAVAAIAVVVAIAVSSGGGDAKATKLPAGSAPVGAAAVAARFEGIPQHNLTLGKSSARVTMEEYADLKCPICRAFTASVFPQLLSNEIRAGRLRVVFRPQTFVGQPAGNSIQAARFALAAGLQNRLWQFVDLFYLNQQDESTAYVDDVFLRQIGSGVQGLDVEKALADSKTSPVVERELRQAEALFRRNHFSGTPSFTLGRTGGTLKPLEVTALDLSQFSQPIEQLLKG